MTTRSHLTVFISISGSQLSLRRFSDRDRVPPFPPAAHPFRALQELDEGHHREQEEVLHRPAGHRSPRRSRSQRHHNQNQRSGNFQGVAKILVTKLHRFVNNWLLLSKRPKILL